MDTCVGYDKLKEWDHRHLWHPFTQMQEWLAEDPLVIVRGEKHYLYDTEGRRYLDGVSSLWANLHGHCRPEINEAIRKQLDLVSHSTLLGLANAPSAVCAREIPSFAFRMAWFRPLICEVKRVAIASPAASSLALLMRKPDDKRCKDVASLLLEVLRLR